ncbi:helix-turn-helix transcriptional regulator [Actinosynnema sp. NPDC020468]|uniref:helix-turn-helix domain-containing protein n=1 Tax=Actinosynnema sp. NPDC020468 TaxID=3154488 RepID=UPI0033C2F95F
MAGDDRTPVDLFHRAVLRLFTVKRAGSPVELIDALDRRRLLPWGTYATLVFELDTTVEERKALRSAWDVAFRTSPVVARLVDRDDRSALTPVNPVLDSELQATDPAGFTALLKVIQVRSGLTPARIGVLTGISRSQVYSMLSRGTLPSKPGQVVALVEACGLSHAQVRRVMALWSELRWRGRFHFADGVVFASEEPGPRRLAGLAFSPGPAPGGRW